jgi:hypothetical protein
MTIQDLGAIGELVGAVAVLATLFYLARQIKQNTDEIRSANYHSVTDSFNYLNTALAQDAVLANIYRRGSADFDSLSDDEKVQFNHLMHATFRVMDVINFQSHHGTGDQTLWDYEKKTIDSLMTFPGTRRWWQERPFNFSDDFVKYVETEVLSQYENDS